MAFSIIVFERIPNKWVKEDSVGVLLGVLLGVILKIVIFYSLLSVSNILIPFPIRLRQY